MNEALSDLIGKQVAQAGELAQTALTCLTIFPQPRMIVEAAEAACGEAADGLDALVENGVIALEQDDVQRYGLHPTALDYARSKQDARGKMQEAKQRAANAYVEFAKANWRDNDLLASEHDNLIAALEWAWAEEQWSEVSNLTWYIDEYLRLHGYWQLATTWMDRGLEATRRAPESNEQQDRLGKMLHSQGQLKADLGDLNGALALYQQSLDIKERLGDLQGKSATLNQMAVIFQKRGRERKRRTPV